MAALWHPAEPWLCSCILAHLLAVSGHFGRWLASWIGSGQDRYSGQDAGGCIDQKPRPGSIDNSALVDSHGGLIAGLIENKDFNVLCKKSWDQLVQW